MEANQMELNKRIAAGILLVIVALTASNVLASDPLEMPIGSDADQIAGMDEKIFSQEARSAMPGLGHAYDEGNQGNYPGGATANPSLSQRTDEAGVSPGTQTQDCRAAYLAGYAAGYRDGMMAAFQEVIEVSNQRTEEVSKINAGYETQPMSIAGDLYKDIKRIIACYIGCRGRPDYWECVDQCLEPIWGGTTSNHKV